MTTALISASALISAFAFSNASTTRLQCAFVHRLDNGPRWSLDQVVIQTLQSFPSHVFSSAMHQVFEDEGWLRFVILISFIVCIDLHDNILQSSTCVDPAVIAIALLGRHTSAFNSTSSFPIALWNPQGLEYFTPVERQSYQFSGIDCTLTYAYPWRSSLRLAGTWERCSIAQ